MRISWICVCVMLCVLAGVARAGYCLDEAEREEEAKRLEAMANRPAAAERSGADSSLLMCVVRGSAGQAHAAGADERFRTRAIQACKKLVVIKPTEVTTPVIASCADLLVASGTVVVDKTDLIVQMMRRRSGPFDAPGFETMAKSKDERVRPYVVEKARAALAKMAKRRPRGWQAAAWLAFRVDALAALALVGTADDTSLVDDLASSKPASAKLATQAKRARDALAAH